MRRRHAVAAIALLATGWVAAQEAPSRTSSTSPATRPATSPASGPADARSQSADQMLGQMLNRPASRQARALPPPIDLPTDDRTSGSGAVRPAAPPVPTLREGTLIIDRVGRISKSLDGTQSEFIFESDG